MNSGRGLPLLSCMMREIIRSPYINSSSESIDDFWTESTVVRADYDPSGDVESAQYFLSINLCFRTDRLNFWSKCREEVTILPAIHTKSPHQPQLSSMSINPLIQHVWVAGHIWKVQLLSITVCEGTEPFQNLSIQLHGQGLNNISNRCERGLC